RRARAAASRGGRRVPALRRLLHDPGPAAHAAARAVRPRRRRRVAREPVRRRGLHESGRRRRRRAPHRDRPVDGGSDPRARATRRGRSPHAELRRFVGGDPMKDLSITTPTRVRPRRLRRTPALRDLVAETRVTAAELIMPHFVLPTAKADVPIGSMPGISQHGIDNLLAQVEQDLELGIRAVLLFGHPEEGTKSPDAAAAASANGAVQRAVEALKRRHGDALIVMTDVCLCAYTSHGHCGVLRDGRIDNDASLEPLVAAALSHARAGADVVAPSDMMDGRVAAIRDALDAHGFDEVVLMSYAVKYASAYYGPFREAADSAP